MSARIGLYRCTLIGLVVLALAVTVPARTASAQPVCVQLDSPQAPGLLPLLPLSIGQLANRVVEIVVAAAGVASAQPVCIELIDTLEPIAPSVLLRLLATPTGEGTVSVVGRSTHPGAPASVTRVVNGAGTLIGGQFELSLYTTDISSISLTIPTRAVITNTTHIHLDGPAFTSGIFDSVHVRTFEDAFQTFGQTTTLIEGTATIVPCPPLS
jgi:hypothetical protein